MNKITEEREKDNEKLNYETDEEVLMRYRIEDLFYSHHSSFSKRLHGRVAYFVYVLRAVQYLYVAVYMDWTIIFRHPINFIVLILFFLFSICTLFLTGVSLSFYSLICWCISYEPHDPTIVEKWAKVLDSAKRKDDNATSENDESIRTVKDNLKEGMKLLGNNNKEDIQTDNIKRNLNKLLQLKALLFFSTMVYVRKKKVTSKIHDCIKKLKYEDYNGEYNEKLYKNAYETLCENNDEKEIEKKDVYKFEDIENKIRGMIHKDEDDIQKELKELDELGIEFTSISELNTDDGGSFCGMFWSEKDNFIVVAFKGTTPTNFAEWLNNLTFQCVDARNFLFGQVHRGFYHYLFPVDEEDAGENYPCYKIVETINRKAKTLREKNNGKKVNLWVTGHSLGGALATLFYTRLLMINSDSDPDIDINDEHENKSWKLQGATTFASPAVGDNHFAAQLASLTNVPKNEISPLWRIVLNDDIVPKLPYRACEKSMRKYGYHYNVLMNFSQVGDKVVFYGAKKRPTSIKRFFRNTSDDDLEYYCRNYRKQHATWKMFIHLLKYSYVFCPFYMYKVIISHHPIDGYFKALIEYEKKLNSKEP